ncbi:serine/threonine protein kinase [Sulfolobus sp. E5-1-F]|uniref:serine/threonine protein kinase n=1 Tax=Sulfolobaceae TaxID=118883 RepID=UPI0012976E22|nr:MULTISPECIES: serine/threonine protein kinase [unclassified Sulfolobus]QGA54292.1 serine/threonine protein kinase [Sulfolobus sp. E5-1-F]QGA69346.1 serine/threonine protein kinase [Sulfolobus sp. E11-6]
MVKISYFIYPYYSKEVEEELRKAGFDYAFSFGQKSLGRLKVLGKGKTGIVVLVEPYKALKIRRTDAPKETLEIEAKMQIKAGEEVAPRVYDYGKNFILMEYIRGRNLTKNETRETIIDLLKRARILEEKFIEHKELRRPWENVMVTNSRTYIIDYDSATIKEKPRNVTKLLSNYLNRRDLAVKYSKSEITFEQLLSQLF